MSLINGKPRRRVAIVGAGLSLFMRRALDTGKELSYYAASQALDAAGVRRKDIQAVVMATAPDAFDGVHMKGEWLLDGAGGVGKPYLRAYVGGGSGVFSIISGWMMVASGLFDLVLVVAEEKMSSCQPHPQGAFLTIFDHIIERPLGPNLLWIFSLEQQRYMAAYGIQNEDIALVSVKNKHNALAHPAAQVAEPYDPFAYKELHHLEGLQLADRGKAPDDLARGRFDRGGELPSCPSGGLMGVGNPIAAAGLMKICELFWQLRGEAGTRQVAGNPERGLAQAWGDLMQVGTVAVLGVR